MDASTAKVASILANPEGHGFEWTKDETVKHLGKTFPAECIRVTDMAKFDATFPGVGIKATTASVRIAPCQSTSREARGQLKPAALREKIINSLLGIEAPRTTVEHHFYAKIDGQLVEFASEKELEEALEELTDAEDEVEEVETTEQ